MTGLLDLAALVRALAGLPAEDLRPLLDRLRADLNARADARDRPFLTVAQAADVAAVSTATVRRWIREGRLTRHGAGRRPLLERAELAAFLPCRPRLVLRVHRSSRAYQPRRAAAAVAERDGWRCHLCRRRIDPSRRAPDPLSASVDHVLPVSDGGTDHLENLRLAHLGCNARRGRRLARPGGDQLSLGSVDP